MGTWKEQQDVTKPVMSRQVILGCIPFSASQRMATQQKPPQYYYCIQVLTQWALRMYGVLSIWAVRLAGMIRQYRDLEQSLVERLRGPKGVFREAHDGKIIALAQKMNEISRDML
ncbi:hypothetical protein E2562_034877 [Oryza meyeriana var. granulata]|uniref:Uncharacterized protein n=1 Tax=Oryza meyeriana var. granulata TaxID=110450 RepID=A0A6G1C1U9_9ORYZ|nr:hypothetical protein E2562_034877 [Oryza meyeriana var. granulata]